MRVVRETFTGTPGRKNASSFVPTNEHVAPQRRSAITTRRINRADWEVDFLFNVREGLGAPCYLQAIKLNGLFYMFPSVLSVVKTCDCSSEKAKKHYREKMAFSQSSSVSAYRIPRFLRVARTVKPKLYKLGN